MKNCSTCGVLKDENQFHKHSNKCKSCYSIYWALYYPKSKAHIRHKNQRYYQTKGDIIRAKEREKGRLALGIPIPVETDSCQICGKTPTTRSLSVDHCHKTNRFRGFLCSNCNLGLGYFKDNPELLEKAKDYLEEFNARYDGQSLPKSGNL